jgi:hypothetical protein
METITTKIEAAKTFWAAAEYIREYGWQVTGMSKHGNPRCSMGALASARGEDVWESNLASLMYAKLYDELGGISLTEFNYLHNDGEYVARLFELVSKKLSRHISTHLMPAQKEALTKPAITNVNR